MARNLLQSYMLEMIRERRGSEKKEERFDLFSSLLDASADGDGDEANLSASELIGIYLAGAIRLSLT